MKTNIELRQIRDFGQIITDTLVFVKENFKPLFKAVAVICGFFIVMTMVSNVLMDSKTLGIVNSIKNTNVYSGRAEYLDNYNYDYFMRVFLLGLSSLLSYTSVYLTTYCYIVLYREKGNQPPGVEEVWGYFKFYFFRIFGSGILMGMILGFAIMLCFSGIYLIPAFSILLSIMVIENASFSYAWTRSFKLVSNYWWQTFGVVFIVALMVFFISLFLTLPGSILVIVQTLIVTQKISGPAALLTGVLKGFVLFSYTLPAIANCLCYFSLVEIKEGTGLMDRIEMLGKGNPGDQAAAEEY